MFGVKKVDRLVELANDRKTVFVGDTHGDFDASQRIVEWFPPDYNRLVFLGDYVDRGDKSQENVDFLLGLKNRFPENVILLMGNHETYPLSPFTPADWWESIEGDSGKFEHYANEFSRLPLAVSVGNILAVHAMIPAVESLPEIDEIHTDLRDVRFQMATWGRWNREHETYMTAGLKKIMAGVNKKILIRGHDTRLPTILADDMLMTLITTRFSSSWFGRRVAILEKGENPERASDLHLMTV